MIIEDPLVNHSIEEVDYGCTADSLTHQSLVDSSPDPPRDCASVSYFPDESHCLLLIVFEHFGEALVFRVEYQRYVLVTDTYPNLSIE